jgi:hypothetical protein
MTTKTFTLPFLDRYYDLQALARFYHRGWHRGAGFLLLYGRHGVGKPTPTYYPYRHNAFA